MISPNIGECEAGKLNKSKTPIMAKEMCLKAHRIKKNTEDGDVYDKLFVLRIAALGKLICEIEFDDNGTVVAKKLFYLD